VAQILDQFSAADDDRPYKHTVYTIMEKKALPALKTMLGTLGRSQPLPHAAALRGRATRADTVRRKAKQVGLVGLALAAGFFGVCFRRAAVAAKQERNNKELASLALQASIHRTAGIATYNGHVSNHIAASFATLAKPTVGRPAATTADLPNRL
jgi:hypothetical protein